MFSASLAMIFILAVRPFPVMTTARCRRVLGGSTAHRLVHMKKSKTSTFTLQQGTQTHTHSKGELHASSMYNKYVRTS
jgi:hypothetical protein